MTEKKFFFLTPNFFDDAELSVYAFRLMAHFLRVCGDTGVCTQGTRLLAEWCGMSVTSVIAAKKELKQKGLILIRKIQTPNGKGDEIRLKDFWNLNTQIYDKGLQMDIPKNPTSLQRTTLKAGERFFQLKSKNRNTKLPEDFKLDKEMRRWAEDNVFGIDVDEEFENFVNQNSWNKSRNWKSYFKKWLKDAVNYKT